MPEERMPLAKPLHCALSGFACGRGIKVPGGKANLYRCLKSDVPRRCCSIFVGGNDYYSNRYFARLIDQALGEHTAMGEQ